MRRTIAALTALLALALAVTGCGGSSKKAEPTTTASTKASSGGGDAAAVLASVKTGKDALGPTKVKMVMDMTIKGAPTSGTAAQFKSLFAKPIKITIDGVSNAGDTDGNINLTIADKPIAFKFISANKKSYIGIGDKWFDSGAVSNSTSALGVPSTGASSLDTSKITNAAGDIAKVLKNTSVNDDTVEGISTDHISGDLDPAGFAELAKAQGSSSSITPAQIAQIEKVLKTGKMDVWVGKDDHLVHRLTLKGDVDTASLNGANGLDGIALNVDITSVPTDKPSIAAPKDIAPQSELQTALLTQLQPLLASLQSGSTGA